jgi:ketosteroid isomerase-like protein
MNLETAAEAMKHSWDTFDRGPFAALFAPGCVNWHQSDKIEHDAASGLGPAALKGAVEDLSAEIVQHVMFEGGQLIQLIVRGKVISTGRDLYGHFCFVLHTSDEGITRIEDFDDPNFAKAFAPAE